MVNIRSVTTRRQSSLRRLIVASVLILASLPASYAQGTAFTYQGRLINNGQPASGFYDFIFTLFGNNQYGFPAGPVVTNLDISVTEGFFVSALNFGGVFTGSNYWLEIAVRTNGSGEFTILQPRQAITPAPYAMFSSNASVANSAANAASVPAAGIVGTIPVSNLSSSVVLLTANGTLPTSVLPTNLAPAGGTSWQSPPATTLQAQPNTGYVLTNSQLVTVTLPASPNVGDIVEITGAGLGGWMLQQNPGQTVAASFSPLSLAGDAQGDWVSIASSADGSRLVAANNSDASYEPGGVWISTNSGKAWFESSAPTGNWSAVVSSADGLRLIGVVPEIQTVDTSFPGGVWTSGDAGNTWFQASPLPGYAEYFALTASSDGTRVAFAAGDSGSTGIWASTNSGTNWLRSSAPTNLYWTSLASSSNGVKLAAATLNTASGSGIWISSDSGSNWAQATDLPTADWKSIASSSDGAILIAAAEAVYIGSTPYPGGIWVSRNGGAVWTQTPAPAIGWTSVSSSSDGKRLAAVASGVDSGFGGDEGGIWTSGDSGTNWVQVKPPGVDWNSALSSSWWDCIASSSDGTKLAAGISGGGIWTIANGVVSHESAAVSGATMLGNAGLVEGNFGTVIQMIYAGAGQFVTLYQTGSLLGH